MSVRLINKVKVAKHQVGGVASKFVSTEKSPDFYKQLQILGIKLRQKQAEATTQFKGAYPNIPVDDILTRASKQGFGNNKLDSLSTDLQARYGDKTIPMSPEYTELEQQYTDLTNRIRGLPMSSTGSKEEGPTKLVSYRTIAKRYPRGEDKTPYSYFNKAQ